MNEYNMPTPPERERLEMLAEEAAEVIQAVTKVLRHGWNSFDPTKPQNQQVSNRDHLTDEVKEMFSVAEAMMIRDDIPRIDFRDSMMIWKMKLRWTHFQGESRDWNDPSKIRT